MDKRLVALFLVLPFMFMVSCSSTDEEEEHQEITEAENVVTVDGVKKNVVRLVEIPISSIGGTLNDTFFSADLELEDGSTVGFYMEGKTAGRKIDLSSKAEAYDISYYGSTFRSNWQDTRQDDVRPGSFLLWSATNDVYEIEFRIEDTSHVLEGHYKGGMTWN